MYTARIRRVQSRCKAGVKQVYTGCKAITKRMKGDMRGSTRHISLHLYKTPRTKIRLISLIIKILSQTKSAYISLHLYKTQRTKIKLISIISVISVPRQIPHRRRRSPKLLSSRQFYLSLQKSIIEIVRPLMVELQKMLNSGIGKFKLQMLEAPRKPTAKTQSNETQQQRNPFRFGG